METLENPVLTNPGTYTAENIRVLKGLEAVRTRRAHVDLLLTDLVMPGMSGTELAAALADEHPGLKVLFMTGHADDAALHPLLASGEADFIQKPFTNDALLAHLRRLLHRPTASG